MALSAFSFSPCPEMTDNFDESIQGDQFGKSEKTFFGAGRAGEGDKIEQNHSGLLRR